MSPILLNFKEAPAAKKSELGWRIFGFRRLLGSIEDLTVKLRQIYVNAKSPPRWAETSDRFLGRSTPSQVSSVSPGHAIRQGSGKPSSPTNPKNSHICLLWSRFTRLRPSSQCQTADRLTPMILANSAGLMSLRSSSSASVQTFSSIRQL